jgi:hypothetical protein
VISVAVIALLRLIPYAFIVVNAWTKGYKWLTLAGLWFIGVATFNYVAESTADVRAILASVSALLLLMHALDLKPRRHDQ